MDVCTRTVAPAEAAELQEILDHLAADAVLCLSPGVYKTRLVLRRSVTLRGTAAPGEVVLDADGHGSAVKLDAPKLKVVIERLTITGGASKGGGGGISWLKPSDLVLREVVIRDNAAPTFGGGGIEASLGTLLLDKCRIERNRGPQGGGVLAHTWAKLTLRDSLIVDNQGKACGGLAVQGGAEVAIERSTIAGNRGRFAIDVQGETDHAPTLSITDSIISDGQGALANDEGALGKIKITRSVVHGKTTRVAGAGDYGEAAGAAFTDGGDNHLADPLLDDDWRPKPGSPALVGKRRAGALDPAP